LECSPQTGVETILDAADTSVRATGIMPILLQTVLILLEADH
jgi:hypothetical protein